MAFPDLRTDWSLLYALLRFARRDGWTVAFGNGQVLLAHRRAARGVVAMPATLLGHARETGWRVARRPDGFELRHPAVRLRIEVRLVGA